MRYDQVLGGQSNLIDIATSRVAYDAFAAYLKNRVPSAGTVHMRDAWRADSMATGIKSFFPVDEPVADTVFASLIANLMYLSLGNPFIAMGILVYYRSKPMKKRFSSDFTLDGNEVAELSSTVHRIWQEISNNPGDFARIIDDAAPSMGFGQVHTKQDLTSIDNLLARYSMAFGGYERQDWMAKAYAIGAGLLGQISPSTIDSVRCDDFGCIAADNENAGWVLEKQ